MNNSDSSHFLDRTKIQRKNPHSTLSNIGGRITSQPLGAGIRYLAASTIQRTAPTITHPNTEMEIGVMLAASSMPDVVGSNIMAKSTRSIAMKMLVLASKKRRSPDTSPL